MKDSPESVHHECATPPGVRVLRFPHVLGGAAPFRALTADEHLEYLASSDVETAGRFLTFDPPVPARDERFSISIATGQFDCGLPVLLRLEVRMPSGQTRTFAIDGRDLETSGDVVVVPGFRSAAAGDLYVSAEMYFDNGTTVADARTTLVLSRNPDFMTVNPRVRLVSGRAGRVEYDWDTNQFSCRANVTITNGSDRPRTYRRTSVRVWDGGIGGELVAEFSFAAGPFTVQPGQAAYRSVDTRYAQGGAVWSRFNKRFDLTVEFTYESDEHVSVSGNAVYRPMSTIPINVISTTDFTRAQKVAVTNALAIAADILEDRDITLSAPSRRVITDPFLRARFNVIDIGWTNGAWDFDEPDDMNEEVSGPDGDRVDVFIPLAIAYASAVPADKRGIGGLSPVNGPFPKDSDRRRSGLFVLMDQNDQNFFGVAIAHEVCHYLGLEHVTIDDNLMQANGGVTGHNLTWDQWRDAVEHGMAKWLAPDI